MSFRRTSGCELREFEELLTLIFARIRTCEEYRCELVESFVKIFQRNSPRDRYFRTPRACPAVYGSQSRQSFPRVVAITSATPADSPSVNDNKETHSRSSMFVTSCTVFVFCYSSYTLKDWAAPPRSLRLLCSPACVVIKVHPLALKCQRF